MRIFRVLAILLISLLIFIGIWWFFPARTPRIKTKNTNAIASIEYLNIGGIEQCVLIRTNSKDNPIMLFMHGGPGMPMMYMAHEFQRPLEENFTVVQWDRRGAGKTYFRNKPDARTINTRQIIDDAYTLIDTLRNRYKQDKIILVGHSFGTYLGSIMVQERPELFQSYISIGQVVDFQKEKLIQEEFIRRQAILNGKDEILNALNTEPKPNFEGWLFEFGGELKKSKSFFPLIWSGLKAPEYTLQEALNLAEASSFSSSNMSYNVLSKSIYDEINNYTVPVYFFIGKWDYTTPHELVSDYFKKIKAPIKELVYFENSAHFPFFEEPEKFCYEIKRILHKN